MPAANVSLQLSLVYQEPSGTFTRTIILTGAMSPNTIDASNTVIMDEVRVDNIVICGVDKDDV
ncbi:glycogen/starch/alpha-glucan phosphorylase [Streptococcus hyointestinalis]|uniref:glycogen/starch/alpha-glucan phosphorylase n=1 Tax=Streptococcus hyointestinalis TaxID=1337 RepID=UPI003D2F33A1